MSFHCLELTGTDQGLLRFGFLRLIDATWVAALEEHSRVGEIVGEKEGHKLGRFGNDEYWRCTRKVRHVLFSLLRSLEWLNRCAAILESGTEDSGLRRQQAHQDILYHLDSTFVSLRILADCVCFTIPILLNNQTIPNRSFRKQMGFFGRKPCVDAEYAEILKSSCQWFELLAGRQPKGVRDQLVHDFATYQVSLAATSDGRRQLSVYLVTTNGVAGDLLCNLGQLLGDFLVFLDLVYELFWLRLSGEFPSTFGGTLENDSGVMEFSGYSDLATKFLPFPVGGSPD